MRCVALVAFSAIWLSGCAEQHASPAPYSAPQQAAAREPAKDYVEIGRAADGQVSLVGGDGHILIRVGDATTRVPNPLRAVKLSIILDAPGSIRLLHDRIALETDDASLEARYAFNTDPGVFAVNIRIDGKDMHVTWSIEGIPGQPDACVPVPVVDSTRLGAALRGYLMKKRTGERGDSNPRPPGPQPGALTN